MHDTAPPPLPTVYLVCARPELRSWFAVDAGCNVSGLLQPVVYEALLAAFQDDIRHTHAGLDYLQSCQICIVIEYGDKQLH